MDSVVVDTDVFSLLFKGDSRRAAYSAALDGNRTCVSFMTVAELLRWGITHRWGDARRRMLRDSLDRCVILPYDLELAETWATITAACARAGKPIGCADCWIKSSALRHNLPLVTHNATDYSGIEGLRLITHNQR